MAIVTTDKFRDQAELSAMDYPEFVKVRRWDDTSAPNLDGQNGSLITVLDAVLVDGYGSQSALGWIKAYSGTDKAAYRVNTTHGTGFYVRVDDGNATSSRAEVKGYESMTGVDSGTDPFPNTDTMYITKSSTTDSTERPWIVYGDSTGFWLLLYIGSTATGGASDRASLHFLGDFVTKAPDDDEYNCVVSGNDDGSTYSKFLVPKWLDKTGPAVTNYDLIYVARKADGTGNGGDNSIQLLYGTYEGTYPGVDGVRAASWNGVLLYSSWGGLDDCASYTYRGFLPAIYSCWHRSDEMTDDTAHGDLRYHKLGFQASTIGGALFDVVNSFRQHI